MTTMSDTQHLFSKHIPVGQAGAVTLSVIVNPFEMTKADQEFIFGLIDTVREYETRCTPAERIEQIREVTGWTPERS